MTETLSRPARPKRTKKNCSQRLFRLLHSWLSMFSLLVVLFFSATGLTLNHQDWTFGQAPQVTTTSGTLPAGAIADGHPNYLVISEYLRSQQGATGEITDYGLDGDAGRISYAGPGYTGAATFSVSAGTFSMESTRYGLVAIANDLHKGRHTSPAWSLTIDIVAVVLVLVSLTGLVLGLVIPRRRRSALILMGLGVAAGVALLFVG
ncbi:MAG: PepSY-associated TM helix domain-containing protein [Actinobacteria bacterium]|nr:PepSY-associated TM helix domain-containing protein [Actinomycetota bacterium]